jgi:hypothetical protein
MGEAKRRGPPAHRQAEGIRKRKLREAEAQVRREKRWAAMSPQDREMALLMRAFGVPL